MTEQLAERLESIEQAFRQTDRPFTFKEAAQFLSCSKSYLYKLTHRRLVPCYKPMGKRLYFKKQELEGFMLQRPVKTASEIERTALSHSLMKGGL